MEAETLPEIGDTEQGPSGCNDFEFEFLLVECFQNMEMLEPKQMSV